MKATELMIGDLLTFSDCVNYSDFPILRVDGILPDSLFIRIDNSEADDEIGYEDVVGIPLTREILEKNGLTLSGDGDYFSEDKLYELEISVMGDYIFWTINGHEYELMRLRFVHELQHAISIFGIDKKIEL